MCYGDEPFDWEVDDPLERFMYSGTFKSKAKGTLEGLVRGLYTPFCLRTSVCQMIDGHDESRDLSTTNPGFYSCRAIAQSWSGLMIGLSGLFIAGGHGYFKEALIGLAVTNLVDLVRPRGKYKLP